MVGGEVRVVGKVREVGSKGGDRESDGGWWQSEGGNREREMGGGEE